MRQNRDKHFLLTVGIFLVVSVLLIFLARMKAANLFLLPEKTWRALRTTASYQTLSKGDKADQEREIVERAFQEVDFTFNPDRQDSLLSQLNQTAGSNGSYIQVRATCDLMRVMVFALRAAKNTKGAYDPTIAPLFDAWLSKSARGAVPTEMQIKNLRPLIGWRHVKISMTGPFAHLSLDKKGTKIDLDRLVQGYAVDLAYVRLKEAGAKNFRIGLGDTFRVAGNRYRNRKGWKIPVGRSGKRNQKNDSLIWLRDGEALCTTGNDSRFNSLDSSIRPRAIDPRTATTIRDDRCDVCVIARNAMAANAYSTAIFIMGREAGEKFASDEHTIVRLVYLDDN